MNGKGKADWAGWLLLLALLAALAVAGTLDCAAEQGVEEFRREWQPVVDCQGVPQVVRRGG